MLSQFNEPPIVVCVLCRGSVSVRKGDRSRFYNHISQDHEVHYDLELFFTLSYLEEQEKGNFITVMNQKIDNSSSETMFVSRQTNQEPETSTSEAMTEDNFQSNVVDEFTSNSNDKSNEETSSSAFTISDNTYDGQKSIDPHLTSKVNLVKMEKQRCPQCRMLVSKKSIQIHMKLKHRKHIRVAYCQICEKSMNRNSINRHLQKVHGILDHKINQGKNTLSDETPPSPPVKEKSEEEKNMPDDDSKTDEALDSEEIQCDMLSSISSLLPPDLSTYTQDRDKQERNDQWEKLKKLTPTANANVKTEFPDDTVTIADQEKNVPKPDMGTSTKSTPEIEKTKKYQCNQCEFQSARKNNLAKHLNDNHKEITDLQSKIKPKKLKKYQCSQCKFQSSRKKNLEIHVDAIHKGIKYSCYYCDKKFTDQSNLKAHIKGIHEGVRYQCSQCGKLCRSHSVLWHHVNTKHIGFMYECDQCEHQTTTPSSLKNHIQTIHGVKYSFDQCNQLFKKASSVWTEIFESMGK